jgi:hypothetical protein
VHSHAYLEDGGINLGTHYGLFLPLTGPTEGTGGRSAKGPGVSRHPSARCHSPRNAVFSGEVVESLAKSKTDPSRVVLRMDSVQWKDGSAAVKVYLTAWYYPPRSEAGQDLQYGPQQPANRTWNGEGQYPDPNSKVYKPFPGDSSDQKSAVPDTPTAIAGNHRVLMQDVESTRGVDGAVALVSKRTNIKLDKLTTYVLAGSDLLPAK